MKPKNETAIMQDPAGLYYLAEKRGRKWVRITPKKPRLPSKGNWFS